MKALLPSLVLAPFLTCASEENEIHCIDGSRLQGRLVEVQTDRLLFDADFLASPVPLRLDQVRDITLPVTPDDGKGDHIASITLSNGDVLRGELCGIDSRSIRLRTWYAGELELRRSMVDTLEIQDRPQVIYQGPHGLDGWTQDEPATWDFAQGALRTKTPGAIARSLKLPTTTRFAFDLTWRSSPSFRFLFFSDDIKTQRPGNCYELICQGRYIQLQKRWSTEGHNVNTTLGDFANAPDLLGTESSRVEILANRKNGQIRLLVNGRVIKDWTDPQPQDFKPGGGIHFTTQESKPLRISRIEVSTWNGILEGNPAPQDEGFIEGDDIPAPEVAEPEDPTRIRLRNNDRIAGEVRGIEEGKVRLATRFGDIRLPIARLRNLNIHKPEDRKNWDLYEIPKIYDGDIRAWFPDGSRVTFRLTHAAQGRLKGEAQPFGQVDFDQKAFSRIEFNIHDPAFEEGRRDNSDW
ncbi:MAG: hypothetical protein EAZ65_06330 [Verrucomicrobia bacterium]|nr:MAG: hypothetical protein EAZ84_11670 [Verrucomicrobiota bacterium]TAE87661.1 MAG: hypothetical protein EAZ82_06805 [Verrucomicrobiota bacterium]TAF25404.1 MAG: hypothetical protein EAZ71_07940 [Verrucomicrobiota bacterium]TAF41191.1 MAG: hypothetical protein EAZ65_06330 [Verrucomicrobiota bacterium]